MIDLDKFCKEVHVCSATGHMIGISSGEFKELITRLRQAEKDAARYKWLKDGIWRKGRTNDVVMELRVPVVFDTEVSCDSVLDYVVDESMKNGSNN